MSGGTRSCCLYLSSRTASHHCHRRTYVWIQDYFMVSRKKASCLACATVLGRKELNIDKSKAVCPWTFHSSSEGLGEMTELKRSCAKYLLCLVLLQAYASGDL